MTFPAPPVPNTAYRARLIKVLDGDTGLYQLDRGFDDTSVRHIRLIGLNAPERGTVAGKIATAYVAAWFAALASDRDPPLVVNIIGPDKYGRRWLGVVYAARTGACLNTDLLSSGNAKPWDGKGIKPLLALAGDWFFPVEGS